MLHPCYTRYTLKNRVNHQYLQALLHPYTLKRENSILSHIASIYVDIVDTMRYHLAIGKYGVVMIVAEIVPSCTTGLHSFSIPRNHETLYR